MFPPDVLKQHLVVLGKTGAGKSSVLRRIVEYLLRRKKRACIIDIKGDWWGLKTSADGRSAGFPIIAFGSFRNPDATDVPINRTSGADIAELIATGNRPCIIGFRGWMPSEIVEFWIGTEQNGWRGFASTLFSKNEGELYVVISECHNFAPKGRVDDPKSGRVLHWTNRLLSEGRGLGMTFLLDSQRPQKVHNDTLDSCETLVAMRMSHPAARQSVAEWMKGCGDPAQAAAILNSLAGMERGEGWVWSPEVGFGPERIKFPMFETFDSFAPAQLQSKVHKNGWSTVDLGAVKEKLATVIEEAKANDPKELKHKLSMVMQQLDAERRKKAPAAAPVAVAKRDPEAEAKKLQAAVKSAVAKRDRVWQLAISGHALKVERFVKESGKTLAASVSSLITESSRMVAFDGPKLEAPVGSPEDVARDEVSLPVPQVPQSLRTSFPRAALTPLDPGWKEQTPPVDGEVKLDGPQKKLVNAIAWLNSIGVEQPLNTAVSFLAGYVVDGGGYKNPRSALKTKGLIEYRGDSIVLTEEGKRLAVVPDRALTTDDLHQRIFAVLPGPESKILRTAIDVYPESITDEEAGRLTNYSHTGGGFKNPRSRLRTLGLIDYPEKGKIKASDFLFLN